MKRSTVILSTVSLAALLGAGWYLVQPPGKEPVLYTVVRGDSLSKIARDHGVTVAGLRAANGLEGDLIEVDQLLVIPAGEGSAPSLGSGGRGGSPTKPQARRRPAQPPPTPGGGPAALLPPTPKPCLGGPSLDELDEGGTEASFAASRGLSEAQIAGAMSSFLPALSRCLVPGEPTEGVLLLELNVACSGVVQGVAVLDRGSVPGEVVDCVTQGLRAAPFPAHDMPDGMEFQYPMRFY